MKLYVYTLLAACCLLASSCSKSSEDEPQTVISEEGEFYSTKAEGVAKWEEADFIFNRYYSLIDTVGVVTLSPMVLVKSFDGSDVSVIWSLNNEGLASAQVSKQWNSDLGMWVSSFAPQDSQTYNFGDKIQATVKIGNAQVIRSSIVAENKILTDLLNVTFGMEKEEVKNAELARIEKLTPYVTSSTWYEYKPNVAVIWYSSNITNGITLYRFNESKLSQVGEYSTNISLTNNILVLCKKYGLKETPELTGSGVLAKDYVWNNGKVEFQLTIIEDAPVFGSLTSETCKALGITYRKI